MNIPWKVAVIGECMVELHREGSHLVQTYGGDTFNTAAYLSRVCGKDAVIDYMSAVGNGDSFSEGMIEFWHKNGVGSGLTQRLPGRLPGLYAIEVDEAGERSFLYWRNEAAVRGCFQTPEADRLLERLRNYNLIYLSGISLAVLYPESREKLLDFLKKLAGAGIDIAFDFNYRPHLWNTEAEVRPDSFYRRISSLCRWVFLSPEEIVAAGFERLEPNSEQFRQALAELGAAEIIVKNGDKPCLLYNAAADTVTEVELLRKLAPIDTTAAGDSFTAAYLAAAHYGLDPVEGTRRAQKLAGAVIMHPGAIIPEEATPEIFSNLELAAG